jgi:hypothetical protein
MYPCGHSDQSPILRLCLKFAQNFGHELADVACRGFSGCGTSQGRLAQRPRERETARAAAHIRKPDPIGDASRFWRILASNLQRVRGWGGNGPPNLTAAFQKPLREWLRKRRGSPRHLATANGLIIGKHPLKDISWQPVQGFIFSGLICGPANCRKTLSIL